MSRTDKRFNKQLTFSMIGFMLIITALILGTGYLF